MHGIGVALIGCLAKPVQGNICTVLFEAQYAKVILRITSALVCRFQKINILTCKGYAQLGLDVCIGQHCPAAPIESSVLNIAVAQPAPYRALGDTSNYSSRIYTE